MDTLRIRGGVPLSGELTVSGSKNAALPILAASLLLKDRAVLHGIPAISDTEQMLALLARRGMRIARRGESCTLTPPTHFACRQSAAGEGELRGSLYLLGALLAASGEAAVALPGGCDLGGRPFDLHLSVLSALGAEITVSGGEIRARGPVLRGTEYTFRSVSVGATVNAILAATAAKGRTVLRGAAQEPHVGDLIAFLQKAGAEISLPEEGVIVVEGGKPLDSAEHRITPDMIEAGTYLLATAATRGDILLRNAPLGQLGSLLGALRRMGCMLSFPASDQLRLQMSERPRPLSLVAAPYPGFPTDLQPQMAAVLSLASGDSSILETVFPRRFCYAEGLGHLGASVCVEGAVLNIHGVDRLFGAEVEAPDLRGGAALLIAALAAEGETLLHGAAHLARGYAALLPRLRSLGALISDGGDASA